MRQSSILRFAPAILALSACGGSPPDRAAETAAAPAPVLDAELEQVKAVTPVDACGWLTPEKLAAVYPGLVFEVRQKLAPRLSGYAWDSRCTYWAGVGSIEFAKDVPTHTVEIFVTTPASESKALAQLAQRRESAAANRGFQAQPALGADAHAVSRTGMASLFLVRSRSLVQVNVSDLDTPNDEKVRRAVALGQGL
jgi:hypothetical protein